MEREDILVNSTSVAYVLKRKMYFSIKRIFDVFCSLIGILLVIPMAIVIKIIYMFTGDFHSIFYRQQRLGKNGKIIRIFKFRTMVSNADAILQDWLKNNPEKRKEYLKNRKIDNDPRITKIGGFLRKASLDEFPQFLNIFIGDMSLIGPRPVVLDEVENYGEKKAKFLSMRPGLTGYWASNGRSNISYEERMEMELFYVDHCCLRLDLEITINTLFAVIKKDGAK